MQRPRNTYVPGTHLVSCEECGAVLLFRDAKIGVAGDQKGLVVCPDDFDPIHPLDTKQKTRTEGPPPAHVTGSPKQEWRIRGENGEEL